MDLCGHGGHTTDDHGIRAASRPSRGLRSGFIGEPAHPCASDRSTAHTARPTYSLQLFVLISYLGNYLLRQVTYSPTHTLFKAYLTSQLP